jgi:FtsP/CotA-like multicopper oxidase with cupredoxin domain
MIMAMEDDAPSGGRREFIKAGLAASAAPLVITPRRTEAQTAPIVPPSPSTATFEWQIPLPIPEVLRQSSLSPEPTGPANLLGGECGRDTHPRWGEFYAMNPELYELRVREEDHIFTNAPGIPKQKIWGYGGTYPGPSIHARYGKPVMLRIKNELPLNHTGFGTPEISTHLHNLHCPSESDGFPGDFFSAAKSGPTLGAPGQFKDHFYPMVRAGYEDAPETFGDPNQSLGTLWFHDHCLDYTAPNVYRGLAAFYLCFDELDTGYEKVEDNLERGYTNALRLPSGKYDIPIVVQDKRFTPDGQLFWNQLDPDGVLGDQILVNGVIQPYLNVERRKYRFRILNGGPTRLYQLYFVLRTTGLAQQFQFIANDGNLLPAPLSSSVLRSPDGASPHGLRLGMAERADIVFDFSRFPLGTELLLINRLVQTTTRKPDKTLTSFAASHKLMLIRITENPAEPDTSRVPSLLRQLPALPSAAEIGALPVRNWVFDRSGGAWIVNGKLFDVNRTSAVIKKGATEIWDLRNPSGGWTHPVHIHFEEGRILERFDTDGNRVATLPQDRGRKDVYVLNPGERLRVLLRFRDYTGKYPMHCHNLAHEDHAMMVRFDIED